METAATVIEKFRAAVATGEIKQVVYGEAFYWRSYVGGCWWCGKQWHTESRLYSKNIEVCAACAKGTK